MSRTHSEPSGTHAPPESSQPSVSDQDAANAAPPDDSNVGEEDPGAALDDPKMREAMRGQPQPGTGPASSDRSSSKD